MLWSAHRYIGALGLHRDDGKENGNYHRILGYRGYIGIMEKQVETTIVY